MGLVTEPVDNCEGLGLGQKRHHRLLVPQIQFLGGLEQQVVMACAFQRAYDGGSDHATVACNVNGGVFVQRSHGGKVLREGLVKDGMTIQDNLNLEVNIKLLEKI